jgi:hypothetical protein
MATILCGILVMPVGLALSAYYLVRIRREVAAAEDGRLPALEDLDDRT